MVSEQHANAGALEEQAVAMLEGILRRTHLSAPADLPSVLGDEARRIGAEDVAVFLVDLEQERLVHLPPAGVAPEDPIDVLGSLAGRAFTGIDVLSSRGGADGEVLWLPLLDGTERLGVLRMVFPSGPSDLPRIALCERFAHLAAILVVSKGAYTDRFEQVRRRRPMTIATELVRALAPPMVFATDDVVVAGLLEPAYDSGGDALDYALNDHVLHFAIFDAMGHGLPAAGVAAFALSAYRSSRRSGHDLLETARRTDEAIATQYPDDRFVTALFAELDIVSGELRHVAAGHPPPLLLRAGRGRELPAVPATPLGLPLTTSVRPPATVTSLEPGDTVLLVSDGMTEALVADGRRLGTEGLLRFVEREAAADHTPPEVLRRLRQDVVGEARGELRDDATALLVAWKDGSDRRVLPRTVADDDGA